MRIRSAYSAAEFATLVAREDEIERKSGLGSDPLQEVLVALSNTQGGAIFVGVTDDGTITGRRRDQSVDDKIHEAALSARDVGRYAITEVNVEGTPVIGIEVERRVGGFAQTSSGRVLVRRGGRNVALFGHELTRFVSERALHRFETTETTVSLADAHPGFRRELCSVFGWGPRSRDLVDRMREKGLVSRANDKLTVAGALFLTDPAQSLSQNKALVEIRRYPEGADTYDLRLEFGGPLNRQVADATEYLSQELGSDVVVTGLYRHELPRLPEVVLREAIANAVAHRAYEDQGTSIVVDYYPDRVVVTSPGGLPPPVTVETLRQAQAARNQDVIDVLRHFKLAEDAGRGVDVMQDTMQQELLDPPRFEDLGHAVRVTLPLRGPITPRERAWVSDLERRGEIHGSDRLLLVHAARGETLTNSRARSILAADREEARQALQRLRDAGLLVQHGSRGGASYTLVEEIAPEAAFRMTPDELEDHVLSEASKRPLTNQVVREITGLERRRALLLLSRLVQEGKLRRIGERRGARYILRRKV